MANCGGGIELGSGANPRNRQAASTAELSAAKDIAGASTGVPFEKFRSERSRRSEAGEDGKVLGNFEKPRKPQVRPRGLA
jgi:hypothetical protein